MFDGYSVQEVPPAGLRIAFRLLACDRGPLPSLPAGSVTAINDETGLAFGAAGSPGQVSALGRLSDLGVYTLLVLDLSTQVASTATLGQLITSAQDYLALVFDGSPEAAGRRVGLMVFGSPSSTEVLVDFTSDQQTLTQALEGLRSSQGLGSRDLYGSITKAIGHTMQATQGKGTVEAALVVFAAGGHEVGAEQDMRLAMLTAKADAEDSGFFNIFVIAKPSGSSQAALAELATRPDYARMVSETQDPGTQVASVLAFQEALAGAYYSLAICTPVVYVPATLTLRIEAFGFLLEPKLKYDPSGLNGDLESCDAAILQNPCLGLECGPSPLEDFQCGECHGEDQCLEGHCCIPGCGDRICGEDDCGASCGTCAQGLFCTPAGLCSEDCQPACQGKQCGDDGCDGSCGSCGLDMTCNNDGLCVDTCTPSCLDRQCGSDGCDGSCGTCPDPKLCNNLGHCVTDCSPDCDGKQCGSDGCEGNCGTCPEGKTCNGDGLCIVDCVPDCSGKQCGSDGCGGSCGNCGVNKACTDEGLCVVTCAPACTGRQCGDDGCGSTCGTCPSYATCSGYGSCLMNDGDLDCRKMAECVRTNCTPYYGTTLYLTCNVECYGEATVDEINQFFDMNDCMNNHGAMQCATDQCIVDIVMQHCANEWTDCAKPLATCTKYGACLGTCGSNLDCKSHCWYSAFPASIKAWADLQDCLKTACGSNPSDSCKTGALQGACKTLNETCQED
jgi:hypothetical protein